jgi:hypothetical protein
MVHHAPRIQLSTPTHSWENKHQSRHTLTTVQTDISHDNENIKMFKDRMFIRQLSELPSSLETTLLYNRSLNISGDISLLERIKSEKNRESRVTQEMIKRPEVLWEKDNVIYRNNKIYVPKNKEIRDDILHDHYDSPDVGHPGIHRMLELIKRTYWWPTIKTDVLNYVKGCSAFQKNKIIRQPGHVSLSPLPIPEQPWQEISIDMIGPLPKSDEYNSILVIVDRFSKMIHLIPTMTSLSSTRLGKIYKKEIWHILRIPRRIISDRGPQFSSKFMKELCNTLGIERNLSTAYHPQTDGQMERINQEVKTYLRAFLNYQQNNWAKWLPTAEFQYNDKAHSTTKNSPFFLNYGLHPWKGNLSVKTSNPSANEFTSELIKVQDNAKAALQSYNGNMKDRRLDRRPKEKFIPGDSVWLEATNITSNRPSAKLDNKRYGPFEILEAVRDWSYRLKLPGTWAIHNVFHSTLLNRHYTPEFDSQKRPLPPPCYVPQPYARSASICQSIRVCVSPILILP